MVEDQLGGGIQQNLLDGRLAGQVEKRHLVLKRWFTQQHAAAGRDLIDVGTDYGYPFFAGYPPTESAVAAIGHSAATARTYPSSYGTTQLRRAFSSFLCRRFSIDVDPDAQVMVSTGASQTFDALSRTMSGRYVLVPQLTLSTVTSIATGNGAEIVRIADNAHGDLDLDDLRRIIKVVGPSAIRFIYLNSPANPTGQVLQVPYLQRLVDLAREFRVLLVHDHDSWDTVHVGEATPNILQIPGAADVAVTIVSLSKEFGLPGVRVGLIAGNTWAVNALRVHNSEFCVMVPEFCQAAATAALTSYTAISGDPDSRVAVQEQITDALKVALSGWIALGWPPEELRPPTAGFKFLLSVPPAFASKPAQNGVSGAELFDFLVARDAGVKLSPSRSFNPSATDHLRMIIMQSPDVMHAVFDALAGAGIHYDMTVPEGLAADHQAVIAGLDLWNL